MGRFPLSLHHTNRRGWSEEEDLQLIDHIQANGHGCWQSVPKAAGLLRSGRSCRLRWMNYLRPNIKRGNFTDEEERIIASLFCSIGSRWSIIASQLPGRTDNDVRNYWNTHLRRKLSTTTISLFPTGDDGNKTEEEKIPDSTNKDEKTLSRIEVNDAFWEQFLTIRPTAYDTVGEPSDLELDGSRKLIELKNSESPKTSTQFYIRNETHHAAGCTNTGSPPRSQDLQHEHNTVLQMNSESSTPFYSENEDDDLFWYARSPPPRPEALQNEQNSVLQVDSYDPQMAVEDALQNVRIAHSVEKNNSNSDSSTHKKRVIKTPQGEHITTKLSFSLEVLKQHFGMKMDDAADSLGISRSSFKRICRDNGIERWPSRKRKKTSQPPSNFKNMTELVGPDEEQIMGPDEEQIVESNNRGPCFDSPPKETANITAHAIPHVMGPVQYANNSVTIKATYEDDIIKFRFPLSSGMDDLREKVAKRLNLEVGRFKLKHKDDVDDLVLIACDEDLQDCVGRSSRSLDKTTIDMFVFPVTT